MQRSGLPRPTVGVVLNNISISGGKYITAGANFTIGARDKPIHVQREGTSPSFSGFMTILLCFGMRNASVVG